MNLSHYVKALGMPMIKTALRVLFIPFETIFSLLNNWTAIPGSTNRLILLDIKEYKGSAVELSDGTIINKGDRVGEIHVNNLQAKDLNNSLPNLNRLMDEEFIALAKAWHHDEMVHEVKAFYCVTVLYGLIGRKGWEAYNMPDNVLNSMVGFWQSTLKNVFSINKKGSKIRKPKICWISTAKLLCRYR